MNLELPVWDYELMQIFKSWENYSGHESFPIPSSSKEQSPSKFYFKRKGLYEGEQLKLRISFAEHVIKELKLLLNKEVN